jgi:hypothetical protein
VAFSINSDSPFNASFMTKSSQLLFLKKGHFINNFFMGKFHKWPKFFDHREFFIARARWLLQARKRKLLPGKREEVMAEKAA